MNKFRGIFRPGDREYFRSLILLAIPLALQNLLTYGVSFADNLMVGQLGDAAIAGLYLGTLVQTLLQIMLFGLESAMLILGTQYWGAKALPPIRNLTAICLHCALLFTAAVALSVGLAPRFWLGLLTPDAAAIAAGTPYLRVVSLSYIPFAAMLFLLCAMRTVEVVRIGLYNSVVALVVNVGLNYVLIFGKCGLPAMGVTGAAWGTVVARLVELLVVAVYVFRVDRRLRLRPGDLFGRWDSRLFQDLVRYGTPLMAGEVGWCTNIAVQTAIIGQFHAAGIAAASIVDTMNRLLWMGVLGLTAATGILTGKTIGEGRLDDMRHYAKLMQVVFLAIGLLCGGMVFFGRETMISFYNLDATTVPVVRAFANVLAVMMVGRCYQCPCLMGLVKAGGATSFVFKNDTIWVFLWVLPSAFVAQRFLHAPAWAVYALLLSDQWTKSAVAYWKVNRFDWMLRLTRSTGKN